ncbi:MAG: zinc-binding dehydrogenase [Alteromonadales bacterium]|nr:zinc-binding dehydrogenase [Alteromonadales bacterium]
MSEGKLISVIDSEYSFNDYQQAFHRVAQRGRKGRIVLNW